MQSYYVQLFFTVLLVLLTASAHSYEDRLMGWSKANGLWGKRSVDMNVFEPQQKRPENWAKLNTLWGKRSAVEAPSSVDVDDSFSAFRNKRSRLFNLAQRLKLDRAQWEIANGLWGR